MSNKLELLDVETGGLLRSLEYEWEAQCGQGQNGHYLPTWAFAGVFQEDWISDHQGSIVALPPGEGETCVRVDLATGKCVTRFSLQLDKEQQQAGGALPNSEISLKEWRSHDQWTLSCFTLAPEGLFAAVCQDGGPCPSWESSP